MNKISQPKSVKEYKARIEFDINSAPSIATPAAVPSDTFIEMPQQAAASAWSSPLPGREDDGKWDAMIYDLLHPLDDLADMLKYALMKKWWMNAFLVAAGMNQITEDFLHPDPLMLQKSEKYIQKIRGTFGNILVNTVNNLAKGTQRVSELKPSTQVIKQWQQQLAALVNDLALVTTGEINLNLSIEEQLAADGMSLVNELHALPGALRRSILRLPSCFRSFDQRPKDLTRIVDEFAQHWPDKNRLLKIVGIRTSGSYLAPLYWAYLKVRGYRNVDVLTLRPEIHPTRSEHEQILDVMKNDGLVIVCDDPPVSGATFAKVAGALEEIGLSPRQIVLFVQLAGKPETLPAPLQKYPSVLMPDQSWNISKGLQIDELSQIVEGAFGPDFHITKIKRLFTFDEIDTRQHIKALFRLELGNSHSKSEFTQIIQVKGVGLGYFGEHEWVVNQKLANYSPQTIGIKGGLLYQVLPNPPKTLSLSMAVNNKTWMEKLVDYIIERNHQLPAREDHSTRIKGQNAVWEVAGNILSTVFGRGWFLARMPLIDAYIQRVLSVNKPSIIDGEMSLDHWFIDQPGELHLIKMDQAEKAFSHMDLACYDPVYDLAGLAVEIETDGRTSLLRKSYEDKTGEMIAPERWMIHQLVHLWDLNRQHRISNEIYSRRMAKIIQGYYSEIYFHDLPEMHYGESCALDIDGVLETNQLNSPSLTESSARSIYALCRHGYRVLLATGRSLDELKERCAAYHLPGGVAEYGAVLYDRASEKVVSLLDDTDRANLYKLRGRLLNIPGVCLDPDYNYSIRAYQKDQSGKHIALSAEFVAQVLDESGTLSVITAIQGVAQTDFVVKKTNKGSALREWLAYFDTESHQSGEDATKSKPFALAIGDSSADLSLLAVAEQSFAPAHARFDKSSIDIKKTSLPYQRGFEQAVTKLLRHKPGSCPTCQKNIENSDTRFMLSLLSIQEGGSVNMAMKVIALYAREVLKFNVSSR